MSHKNMDPSHNFDMPSSGGTNYRENRKRYPNRYNRRSNNKNWRSNSYKGDTRKYVIPQRANYYGNHQEQQFTPEPDESKPEAQTAKSVKQCSFDDLPDNIISMIFNLLDCRTLQMVTNLSTRFNNIAIEDKVRQTKRSRATKFDDVHKRQILIR